MAMITLSLDGRVLQEIVFAKERITIGRAPHNDLVIDSLGVSAEHAVIVTVGNDYVLEDLNSTNGTQINGQPIRKHFLQDDDVIEIAGYRIRYQANPLRLAVVSTARITVLSGHGEGRDIDLTKALTTIGRPGVQVAVITKRAQGYYLMHVEGSMPPCVNGSTVETDAYEMVHGDIVEIAGAKMRFSIG